MDYFVILVGLCGIGLIFNSILKYFQLLKNVERRTMRGINKKLKMSNHLIIKICIAFMFFFLLAYVIFIFIYTLDPHNLPYNIYMLINSILFVGAVLLFILIQIQQYSINIIVPRFKKEVAKSESLEHELKEAEIASKAKDEFLSKMSHELRTPLNAIIGMINIIDKSNDIEKIHSSVKSLKDASEKLLQTINDVLDFSKTKAGKMELTYSKFNIEKMFSEIVNIMQFSAHEKDIDIKIDLKDSNPICFVGDEKRLSQIYINLLSNAIKFTEKGGKIFISVKYKKHRNNKIEIISSVTDTGIGIPNDKINSLFKSFSQVDNSLARQYTGTGLGLVIVKNIIKLMGGKISVQSEVGVGTTFSFNVFLESSTKQDENTSYVKEEDEHFDFSKKTILLFEDVDINREIIQFMLQNTGATCVEAVDGIEGVDLYNKDPEKYDLIIMDIEMPNMDGFEATKNIRESGQPNAKTIPIIAMTANVFESQVKATFDAGMNSHLGKPVDELEMKKELAKFLNK